jgi:hypothetical protein
VSDSAIAAAYFNDMFMSIETLLLERLFIDSGGYQRLKSATTFLSLVYVSAVLLRRRYDARYFPGANPCAFLNSREK